MFAHFKEDIACVFDRDPAARSTFEVIIAYPGLHAVLFHRVSHALWNNNFYWLARFLSHIARWLTGIEIHPGATIGRRFFIDHGMGVVIGETATIGDDCTLYHGVTLGGTTWNKGKRHPTLKNGVVIGAGAKVLGPITLYDCARVGSNSVVVKDVPEGATVVGVPGQLIVQKDEQEEKREEMADKIGFEAYGETKDMPDPVSNALGAMLDHIHNLESEIQDMRDNIYNKGSADAWQIEKPKKDSSD